MAKERSDVKAMRKRSRFAEKPQQRNAANARERGRMRILSKAFCRLKTTLPWVPADTKLSKLDTLRFAAKYIAHLKDVLKEESECRNAHSADQPPSIKMSWPSLSMQNKESSFPKISPANRSKQASMNSNAVFLPIQQTTNF